MDLPLDLSMCKRQCDEDYKLLKRQRTSSDLSLKSLNVQDLDFIHDLSATKPVSPSFIDISDFPEINLDSSLIMDCLNEINLQNSEFNNILSPTNDLTSRISQDILECVSLSTNPCNESDLPQPTSDLPQPTSKEETVLKTASPRYVNKKSLTSFGRGRFKKYIKMDKKSFACDICQKTFSYKYPLKCHKERHINKMNRLFACDHCGHAYSVRAKLEEHIKKYKNNPFTCMKCNQKFCKIYNLREHMRKQHSCASKPNLKKQQSCSPKSNLKEHMLKQQSCSSKSNVKEHMRKQQSCSSKSNVKEHGNASKSKNPYTKLVKTHQRKNALDRFSITTFNSKEDNDKNILLFLQTFKSNIENELKFQLFEKKRFKWYMNVKAIIHRVSSEEDYEIAMAYFQSYNELVLNETNITSMIQQAFQQIMEFHEQFIQKELDWTVEKILKMDICTMKCNI